MLTHRQQSQKLLKTLSKLFGEIVSCNCSVAASVQPA